MSVLTKDVFYYISRFSSKSFFKKTMASESNREVSVTSTVSTTSAISPIPQHSIELQQYPIQHQSYQQPYPEYSIQTSTTTTTTSNTTSITTVSSHPIQHQQQVQHRIEQPQHPIQQQVQHPIEQPQHPIQTTLASETTINGMYLNK